MASRVDTDVEHAIQTGVLSNIMPESIVRQQLQRGLRNTTETRKEGSTIQDCSIDDITRRHNNGRGVPMP